MFIDTHCHLTFPDFSEDLDEIDRAENYGIKKIILPSISLETSKSAVELAEKYSSIFAAIGIHPQDSQQFEPGELDEFYRLSGHPKVVAIGEIGLDYYRDYAPHSIQKKVLRTFLKLSADVDLPVIIHNRSAFADVITILKEMEFEHVKGVFHCFSEDEILAAKVLKMNFVISFTGTITFKNSRSAQIAKKIPLENQLLETDAPFMAPVPKRGKRNEPAFMKYIAEKQAELHAVTVEEVSKTTTDVAFKIFPRLRK